MNKKLHRVIFNAARGLRMVVQETARGMGKGAARATVGATAMLALLAAPAVQAQIAANPFAAAAQRPQVLAAPNGVPLVNITTPSPAGVSVNQYQQFDVHAAGAILNNSRTTAQTQLGGLVQGNPWLAAGPARLIVNQVSSANPSHLNGTIEVAGQRAEVVIANPSGISVNGAGFINASQVTLTTGVPQYGALGSLDAFLVQGGTIRIEGAGLDAGSTDYAAILSRALQVNAALYANELKVATGANRISADHGQVTPTAGSGAAPTFALDVAALGGMYARKITLIGTEAGLGVRNAGRIGAGAGGLVVTAAGRLENTGTLEGQSVRLSSGSEIDNRGGTIRQGSAASLDIGAPTLSNTDGGWIGAEPIATGGTSAGTGGTGTTGTTSSGTPSGAAPAGGSTGSTAAPAPAATPAAPPEPGVITAAGALLNDGGRIYAGGPIALHSPNIVNRGGTLSVGSLALNQASFSNQGGTLNVSGAFSAQVDRFDNSAGTVRAGSLDIASAGELVNTGGTLTSEGDARLSAGGGLNNTRGTITAAGAMRIEIADAIHNTGGTVASNGQTTIAAGSLANRSGAIRAAGASPLGITTAGLLDNRQGEIGAGGNATLAAGALDNDAGRITAAGDLLAHVVGAASNRAGTLAANGSTTLTAGRYDNKGGTTAAVDGDLTVTTGGATTNAGGTMQAGGATLLANAGLDNTQGRIFGERIGVDTHGQQLANAQGTLAATNAVDLQTGALVNDAGLIQSGGALTIDTHGQSLGNANAAGHASGQGGITSAGALGIDAGAVNNAGGFIGAKGALTANTQDVSNTAGGLVLGQEAVSIHTNGGAYDNAGGQTQAVGDLTLTGAGVDNRAGLLRSGGTTTLAVGGGAVLNTGTQAADQGIEGRSVAITAGSLDNAQGAIRASEELTATVGGVADNTGGLMSARGTLTITDPHAADPNAADPAARQLEVINTGGTLVADQGVVVDAARFSGDGEVGSGRDLRIAVTQDIANDGVIRANGDLDYGTTGHLTNNGTLSAGGILTVSGDVVDNTATGEMSGAGTRVNAGTLTNRGLIDSLGETRIDADAVHNIGTGRIYGDHVAIAATALDNLAETVDGTVRAATIAARRRLDIGVQALSNRDGALIYSDGDLAIGGALDAQGRATGSATTLDNHAATIEASGNVAIAARTLTNSNGGVTYTYESVQGEHVTQYMVPGSAQTHDARDVLFIAGALPLGIPGTTNQYWGGWTAYPATNPLGAGSNGDISLLVPAPEYPLERFLAYYLASPRHSADLVYTREEGGDDQHTVTVTEPGAWYAIGDPIWATFGVAPPAAELPPDNPGRLDPDITVGQTGIYVSVVDPVTGAAHQEFQPFSHPVTQAEYDQYHDYMGAHRRLDAATQDFVLTVLGGSAKVDGTTVHKPGRVSDLYDVLDYDVTRHTPVLQSSAPGLILAGGNMTLTVDHGTNQASQILAGGELNVGPGGIDNVGVTVAAPELHAGTAIHSYVQNDDERKYSFQPYDQTILGTATLAASRQEGHAALGTGAQVPGAAAGQGAAAARGAGGVGQAVSPIVQVQTASAGQSGPLVVRTATPALGVPAASLFSTNAGAGRYLIETDPRFASYRPWLGSDYLLDHLGVDPDNALKRLGDGYYEQRLIREQVQKLTGYRYLDGYTSDEAQFAALMDAGVTFARQYGLTPGVALSAEQMAQLTSDIVWLVEQSVTLPDGSTQRVLVPQVYVRVREGDIDGSGALLSGQRVKLQLTAAGADLNNVSGTIAGRQAVRIDAQNINHLFGRITGRDVALDARQDIRIVGATVQAQHSLSLEAGRDILVASTTAVGRSSAAIAGSERFGIPGVSASSVRLDRIAGLYVSDAGGTLSATAGRDMGLTAAQVASGGSVSLDAGRHLTLDSITTADSLDVRWSADNTRQSEVTRAEGTHIQAAGDVRLSAGRDLRARAVDIQAGQTLSMAAGGDLVIEAERTRTDAETSHAHGGTNHFSLQMGTGQQGLARSSLNAQAIELQSGGDTTLSAVNATAERMQIDTGGVLRLEAPVTTARSHSQQSDGDAWNVSASGHERREDSVNYNWLNVGQLTVRAGGGVQAQVGMRDNLQALAQQPGMGWIHQLQQQAGGNEVHWQRVVQASERSSYSKDGFGPAGALVITAIVGAATAGAGAELVGFATGSGAGAATAYPLSTAVTQAAITNLATQATMSFASNDGNLSAVFDELGSSASVRSLVTSMVTAGVVQGLSTYTPMGGWTTAQGAGWDRVLMHNVADRTAAALVDTALNGGDFGRNLGNAIANGLLDTAASTSANWIGGASANGSLNTLGAAVGHAVAGCLVGAGRAAAGGGISGGSGCGAGAVGAVVGETVAGWAQNQLVPPGQIATLSQTFAGLAGALVTGDAAAVNIAAQAGLNAAANNRILHPDDRNMAAALANRGPYSEQEILDAMRWSNGRNANGTVSPATQQVYGMTGASLGSNSPTGNLAGDMAYDAGLRVRPQGGSTASSSFQEVLPNAPSPALMNFITTNTNGAYQFNTAGMTYSPSSTPDRAQCATAECAAGLAGSQGRGILPDYSAFNSGVHTLGMTGAVNLYDGSVYGGGAVNITNINPGFRPSSGVTVGYIIGVNDAQGTREFLTGAGTQLGISIPIFGRFNTTLGINHSYQGATALEFGITPPTGASIMYSPWGYTK